MKFDRIKLVHEYHLQGQSVRIATSQQTTAHVVGSPINTAILRQQPTVLSSSASPIATSGVYTFSV